MTRKCIECSVRPAMTGESLCQGCSQAESDERDAKFDAHMIEVDEALARDERVERGEDDA